MADITLANAYINPITGFGQSDIYIAPPVNGEPYTIAGTGFGTKSGYSDHINTSGIYDLALDSNFNVIGRWDGSNYVGVSNKPSIKAGGITGNKCLYFFQDVFGAPGRSPNNCLVFNYDSPVQLGETVFSSYWVKHSSNSVTGGQWKFSRWQKRTNSLSDKPSECYWNASNAAPDNKIQVRDYRGVGSAGDYTKFGGGYSSLPHNKNKWMRIDIQHTLASNYLGVGEYKCTALFHDPDAISPPVLVDFTNDGPTDPVNPYGQAGDEWNQHLFQNYFGNGDFGTSQHNLWMDKIFESVGDDLRVEYANSQTWGSQTRSFTQPISSWSDSEIVVGKFDKGDLTSGWIHVISNGASIYSRAA